jgi:hypothetical protein
MTRVWSALVRYGPAVVAWGAVAVFTLVSIGAPLLGEGVFLGTDALVRYAPWLDGGGAGPAPTNSWIGDTIDFYAPQTMLLEQSVRTGDIAWWNPYIIGGTALGSLPDTGLFSPMSWVWFVVPAEYAPGAMKLVEIVVAVLGTALLTRRLGFSSAAQAVAGLVYVSGGFMVAWTNWPHTRVAALVPLLLWAADRVLVDRRARDVVPLALVVTTMLLTGFPAVLGYAVYGLLGFAVVRMLALRADLRAWLRAAALGVAGAALGALLSAWQLVPWMVHALTTIDFAEREQAPWRHLDWTALASAVAPGLIGEVGDHADSFWIASANPVESFSFVGVGAVVLVLATVLLRGRDRTDRYLGWFALGGAALCVALIYQGGWLLGLFQQLPIFSNNSVTRLRFLLTLFLALAAGTGLDRLLRRARVGGPTPDPAPAAEPDDAVVVPDDRRVPAAVAGTLRVLAAAGVVAGLAGLTVAALDLVPEHAHALQRQGVVTAAAAFAGAGLLALVAGLTRSRILTLGVAVALPVLLVGQALSVTRSWWPVSDEDTFYPSTATHDFLADHLGDDRYLGVDWTMLTGTSTPYHLRSVTGHGFHTPEWKAMLRAVDEDALLTKTYSQLPLTAVTSPVLDRMGVRYAVDDPGAHPAGTDQAVGVATANTPIEGGSITSEPLTGPLRAVQVAFPEGVAHDGTGRLTVHVETLDGDVVAESSRVLPPTGSPAAAWVALAAEDVPVDQQVRLVLRVSGTAPGPTAVPTTAEGAWATVAVRPADDGLTVVHGGDATVYERDDAAPRIRWAADEVVVVDEDERLDAIASGDVPTGTVVLEDAADALGLDGSSSAGLDVLEDGGTIRVAVDADGDGWLVVAESLRAGGWTAAVDGEEVALVDADEAMGAVHVPAGTHEVQLTYRPPGLTAGVAGSAVAAVALLALAVVPPLRDRRRRAARP